ncbi:retinoblastoma-like protein 1 isoform X1 [Ruditapes philippinarum]|uniref:retinoblastoma-like protein 1 isoform X1 n=3 Tax=Ruditapes philippinarum TaxID=129788 RepID=UPI00295C32F4|nr:retinoblastoma-like protein 1 isoform X1 [Ruditapes philippinarum]
MVLSEDGEDKLEEKYDELCLDLNMDRKTKEEAWKNYEKIKKNYTLEGDQIHWLSCALYESCRRTVVPTVGRGTVEGNCVSLTRLLRSSKFSLIQFFNKMKKWSDMASLSQEFRDKVERLERNFAVSTVIFKKFEPIFLDIFKSPADEAPRQPRSRKQRKLPCSLVEVFNFCWTMFVQVKGNFPAISDDLVNSYHLLLCNIDWFYTNALLGGRKDLLNPNFSGLPEGFHARDWKPPSEPPCIMKHLCDKHEGLEIEAKVIKEHWWKPHLKKLFDKKVLKGKPDTLSSVLEIGNFEANNDAINEAYDEFPLAYSRKAVNNAYEEYVLSVGDFDERIFLDDDADEEIGTPAKSREDVTGELKERMQQRTSLQQHVDQTRSLAPSTPLTGRRYLKEKDPTITPVSTATQSVSRLQHLLSGRKTAPSDTLQEILIELGGEALMDTITQRVKDMGEIFCNNYVQASESHPGSQLDFAKRRLQLGESLYFKTLEEILTSERKRAENCKDHKSNVTGLLEHDLFHRSLFACCLEIIIFSYNSQRMFPWIVDIFDLSPYHFYKVIEIIVREEEGLSRDVVKHLNHIEECILESLAWRGDSPVWEAIKSQNSDVPQSAEVSLPANSDPSKLSLRRIVLDKKTQNTKDPLLSPTGPSAADRFSSPSPGSAKRRLFSGESSNTTTVAQLKPGTITSLAAQLSSIVSDGKPVSTPQKQTQHLVAFQQVITQDGRQVLIPVQTQVLTPQVTTSRVQVSEESTTTVNTSTTAAATQTSTQQGTHKSFKGGSLGLFFRKVYHLAHVRLRDLCDRLDIDDEDLHRKIWTCLEYVIVHHTELLKDRHLDQIIMCSVYVISKVTDRSQSFQNIMKCYRLQPQAQSHVYRSVLLNSRYRHTSGSSDGSHAEASGTSSPVNGEKEENKEKKTMPMRSSSTLPVPHPSSHPPTPTRMVGTGSNFEFGEERGDLIQFYNQVFITQMRAFALRFSASQNGDAPPLSPLPPTRCHTTSPRRVSSKHSVYISPHKSWGAATKLPDRRMLYCFNRSPSKSLKAINNMIRLKSENRLEFSGKRTLQIDSNDEPAVPPKRISLFHKRLQDVTSDRQEQASKVVIVK